MKFHNHVKTISVAVCFLLLFAFNYYEVKRLDSTIDEISTQIDKLNDYIKSLSELQTNISINLKDKEDKIAVLEKIAHANADKIQSLNSSLSQISRSNEEDITLIRADIEDINNRLESLSTEVAELNVRLLNLSIAVNDTIKRLAPPVTEMEIYSNGTALDYEIIVELFKKSGIVRYNTVYSFTDLIRVAPKIEKKKLVSKIIEWTGIPDTTYAIEKHDCDDYAYQLYAQVKSYYPLLAFGVAHSKIHAFNFIIFVEDNEFKIYFIEPQTGDIFSIENVSDVYLPITFVLI